ncbi:MAG TPA: glycogen debranching N-terminal domain-containing protein [Ilumatobacteraceae bacterium]|nr:glycogen debranching N-terminal domain-containing protein [Ilumatobacteraceae bacterium]
MTDVRVAQPVDTLHGGGIALSCALDGSVSADAQQGLFAGDTRVLSTYRLTLGGVSLDLLSRVREGHGTASWHYQNRAFRDRGGDTPAGSVRVVLRRRVDGAMHDDLQLTSYLDRPLRTSVIVQIDADFADIFEVKAQRLPPRLAVRRDPTPSGVVLEHRRRGFRRALDVLISASEGEPVVVGSRVAFDIELAPGQSWNVCIEAVPELDGERLSFRGDPHADERDDAAPVTVTGPELLATPFRRGCTDLRALAMNDESGTYVAAGVPWFLTLFGRDTLMTSLMSGLIGATTARGALRALAALQADAVDDWRDAEPGKLPHELRRGELARRRLIPHTPYYGSHDTQALYCLALWNAWRWTGDRQLVDDHFDTACAALRWCDERGDRDGDGLQEYGTRSRDGYRDQGWKDAGDAIVTADGQLGSLPLATVELQGYLYAARLGMAELFEERGDTSAATQQRAAAAALAELVEQRFYVERDGFYAVALDGAKQQLTSISSNPGHLLWCGLPSAERAAAVAARLLEPDLYSGWGLRTLSAQHPSYNPLAYQRGSVWPHDTVVAAAGLARYGHHDDAAKLLRAVLDAAAMFEADRLPELFCGFDRASGPPVPYIEANVPQAWAAATPILATQIFLGIVPDAPRQRCYLAPWLPEWLPDLQVRGITIGASNLDVSLSRRDGSTDVETTGDVEVILEPIAAPLWGSVR